MNNPPVIISKEDFQEVLGKMRSNVHGPRFKPIGDTVYMLTG